MAIRLSAYVYHIYPEDRKPTITEVVTICRCVESAYWFVRSFPEALQMVLASRQEYRALVKMFQYPASLEEWVPETTRWRLQSSIPIDDSF
jgi:hypothetical protein